MYIHFLEFKFSIILGGTYVGVCVCVVCVCVCACACVCIKEGLYVIMYVCMQCLTMLVPINPLHNHVMVHYNSLLLLGIISNVCVATLLPYSLVPPLSSRYSW